ncbi:unannotated protein [freshwater metagenome]|uniref:Unannotated protein n=1 Tax=freshwater metagenome TaxID=449393 RepID=A0A6J5ZQ01_9ZZZZ
MARHLKERDKRPALGYTLYITAAVLWSINGTAAKVILKEVGDPLRVSQFRGTATAALLIAMVLFSKPSRFKIKWREAFLLACYGIIGVACCQWFYFESISRMPVTISLLIEFMAPIAVVIYARYVWHHQVRATVWLGLLLAVGGLALVSQVWDGFTLNKLGVFFATLSMLCLVVMYILADKASRGRDSLSLLMWAFCFASIFFAILRPWQDFPWDSLTATVTPMESMDYQFPIWPFFTYMVIGGTIMPYILVIKSIHHIGGAGASITGMSEPPIAAVIAWVVLGEAFASVQILGGFIMLVGVVIAERSRAPRRTPIVSSEVSEAFV